MNACALIDQLRARRVYLGLRGLDLRYVAVGQDLDDAARAQLEEHRPALLAHFLERMRAKGHGGLPADLHRWPEAERGTFEERAAIMEFDGNLARDEAEVLAEIAVRTSAEAREGLG